MERGSTKLSNKYSPAPYTRFSNESEVFRQRRSQAKQLFRVFLFFSAYHSPHDRALLKLSDKFSRISRWLASLIFGIHSSTKFTKNQMIRASKCLQKTQCLKYLKLMAFHFNHVSPLAHFLKNLKRIECLVLDFNEFESLRSAHKFFSAIKTLKTLKEIKIVFCRTTTIMRKQEIKHFCSEMSRLKAIKAISLDFSESTLSVDITNILSDFRVFKSLSVLTFKFFRTQGIENNNILVNIGQGFKYIPQLMKFEIDLTDCKQITIEGIKPLTSNLPSDLICLKMSLIGCKKVNEKSLKCIFSDVAKLSHLKELSLRFNWENKVNDKDVKELSRCLNNLKRLDSLVLVLWKSNEISKSRMKKFFKSLALNISLKELILHFPDCSRNITNKSLEKLGSSFAGIKGLEGFELDIRCCSEVTDKGINEFSKKIRVHEKLQRVHLNLMSCHKVTGKMTENFVKNLQEIKTLESVYLDLRFCKDLNKEIVANVKCLKFKLIINY